MAQSKTTSRRGLRIGRIAGIDLLLDTSVLLIFVLIVASLGFGTLEAWHPEWPWALRWGVALGAGVLFFVSIVLHELAHSLVALAYDIPVPRITLFLFGGLSEMESEPRRPGQEFLVAIAGPLLSLALGIACTAAGVATAPEAFADSVADDPEQAFASLGAGTTLLIWLGPINVVLGLFNLVPGFPLDGGRVLRALLWWTTGDRVKATTWAARAGQGVALLLVGFGLVEVFSGRLGGLWLILVGWFLNSAAQTSHSRMLLEDALEDVRVADLMRRRVESVPAVMPLNVFAREVARDSDQAIWPVLDDDGHAVGTVSLADVQDADRDGTVGALAVPLGTVLGPADEGPDAVRALASSGQRPVLVLDEGGEVVGMLRMRDITRWLVAADLRAA